MLQTIYNKSRDGILKEAQEVLKESHDECEAHQLGAKLWDHIKELATSSQK